MAQRDRVAHQPSGLEFRNSVAEVTDRSADMLVDIPTAFRISGRLDANALPRPRCGLSNLRSGKPFI